MPKASRASSRPTKRAKGKAPAVYVNRLKRLRSTLRANSLDALLISNPRDIHYLTPFTGEDSYALVTPKKFYIISDSRFAEELKSIEAWASIVMRKGPIAPRTGELIRELDLNRVGIQAEYTTVTTRKALSKAATAKRLTDTVGLLNNLRIIKDEHEIRLLRKAVRCQQQGIEATIGAMRLGQSELEIAARLEYEMRAAGAQGAGFDVNVSIGPNGAKPHHAPSAKAKLKNNTSLLIDWGACVDGYRSDMTRVWGIGKMPKRIAEIYRIVLEAQLAAIAEMKPGVRCRDVDAVARAIITDAGYGENYGHGLGHGIGLDIHESPRMSPLSTDTETLRPGMVVTVEPGIYLSGVGGVRIEDDVLITDRGHRVLSDWPKQLEDAILTPAR